MSAPLSTNIDDPDAVPYFLWDQPMTVGEFRRRLREAPPQQQARLLGKLLREARDTDVWRFTSPAEVSGRWQDLAPYLGRRRAFWEYLLGAWRRQGLLGGKQAQ
jgi:hypothetical protein